MKREDVLAQMQNGLAKVTERSAVVQAILEEKEPSKELLGALIVAGDVIKVTADEFRDAVAAATGRSRRHADEFEEGVRVWAAGCYAAANGLNEKVAARVQQGQTWFTLGGEKMRQAIEAMS